MATMIPKDIHEFTTEGEKRFYRFLESVAKPDSKFVIWYLPDVEGKEPDFILFCSDVGLIIFEVKDWALNQIEEATPVDFVLRMGGRKEKRKNPLRQAREYFQSLLDRFERDGRLVSRDPQHRGKPILPIDCGVVFPNINRYEYQKKGLHQVINPTKVFFEDDLSWASDMCMDTTGNCFRKALSERFPPRFQFKLAGGDYHRLKQILFPVVRIEEPERDTCAYMDPRQRVEVLDDGQEAIARNCSTGYHVVRGMSGSGKTLILAHKAAFLRRYRPEFKSILFLCYNFTLVNYIELLLSRKGVPLGAGGVEVYPFHALCSEILGYEIAYEKEGSDYYEIVEEETLDRLWTNPRHYDAVLVDEGQDFSRKMVEIVLALVDPERPNLTVAIDEGQNIYGRDADWRPPSPHSIRLEEVSGIYRNSAEIRRFALNFLTGDRGSDDRRRGVYCETHGPKPKFKQCRDLHDLVGFVGDTIKRLRDQGEYPLSEMAVLYTRRSLVAGQEESIADLVRKALRSRGILSQWVSEDYRAKRAYDITTDRVSLSTIHSAKGLDYACVLLLGLDALPAAGRSEEAERRLVYVGITRARHCLVIPYLRQTALISELMACGAM